jgi:phosphoglycerate dehydrogenase-like enzyme
LPRLKLIASTGSRNAAIDREAAAERGIVVAHTGYDPRSTIELTWALILASVSQVALENAHLRAGGWQRTVGDTLQGKTLGVLGLGNIGSEVARIGRAFGMEVIAWSQNLTPERAQACGARLVSREDLFRNADILTIHLVLSERTRCLVGAAELQAMKPSARLINTSRGPIVDEPALIEFLRERRIAGAALDVFEQEPVDPANPLLRMDNVIVTPHSLCWTDECFHNMASTGLKSIADALAGRKPEYVVNRDVLGHPRVKAWLSE